MNKEVQKIRKLIKKIGTQGYKDGSSKRHGFLYHTIPFPEFSDIKCHKSSLDSESDYIVTDIGKTGSVIDIGCANGQYSFKLYKQAQKVVGYEGDSLSCDVNEAIRAYKEISNIKFVNKYFDEEEAQKISRFDVGLMLNVHMWIYKQIGSKRTSAMLTHLASKVGMLYFQTAHAESGGMFQVKELKNRKGIEKYLTECGFEVSHVRGSKAHGRVRHLFKCKGKV